MSEPDQLYLNVRISRAQRDAFLQAPLQAASQWPDLQDWLARQSYYGDAITPDQLDAFNARIPNAQAWLDTWLAKVHPAFDVAHYDDATQTWTLALPEFAENVVLYANALAVFRQLADFKDIASTDFLLIFGYFYSDHVTAALEITQGAARILPGDAPDEWVDQAGQAVQAVVSKLDGADSGF